MTSVITENDIVEVGGYYVIIKSESGFQVHATETKKEK